MLQKQNPFLFFLCVCERKSESERERDRERERERERGERTHVCLHYCIPATVHMWSLEDNGQVLGFYHVGPVEVMSHTRSHLACQYLFSQL